MPQIMDHKMDMGMEHGLAQEQPTLDPMQSLTPEEVVAVLDLTLACEVSCLEMIRYESERN